MNKKIIALITSILTCVSVGAFVGCKDDDNSSSSSTQSFFELEDFDISFGTSFEIDADGENLIWSSSNENVATVSQDGVVFGTGIGETTITVTDGVQTESCTLTVNKGTVVANCTLNQAQQVQLKVGDTYPLAPSVSVSGVTLDYVTFTYDNANDAVATVDANGLITAVALGDTTISVSYSAGGFDDTVEIPVSVVEDVDIELDKLNVTLAVQEIDGGTYENQTDINVTALYVNGEAVDSNEVEFAIADGTIASFDNGTLTAKKAGATTLTATYQTQQGTTVTVDVAVNVVKESLRVEETGKIDVAWDITVAEPSDYAYIELPYSLQLLDEEVLLVTDANANVLSENNGLRVPKTAFEDAETKLRVETETLVYEFDVAMETSYIQITTVHYASQFSDALGVKAAALGEEMDGRTDVLKTETPNREKNADGSTTAHIWYTHCGYLNFNNLEKSWEKGVFIYDVKAEEGTYLGGWLHPANQFRFFLDTKTMKFTPVVVSSDMPSDSIKIVDENFEETTFQYGEWNTVVVDYTKLAVAPIFMPSFTGGALSVQQEAYYSNMRYMTKDMYEKMLNNSYEKKYTVSFDTGLEDVSFASQEVSFRSQLNTSVLTMDDEYQFIGWTYNNQLIDVDKLYVTQDMTLTAAYDKIYEYKVVYMQRQINGAYKEVVQDTFVGEGRMLSEVVAEIKTYEGYTLNEAFSVTKGKVLANDALVLALYYENDLYTFNKMNMTAKAGKTTATSTEMTGVDFDDLRGNTLLIKDNNAGGMQDFFTFTHGALPSEGYMLLSVYVTANSPKTFGIRGRVGESWTFWSYKIFDENYQVITNTLANVKGKWVTVAVDVSNITTTSSLLCVTEYTNGAELYLGEYTTITTEQYNQYFANANA